MAIKSSNKGDGAKKQRALRTKTGAVGRNRRMKGEKAKVSSFTRSRQAAQDQAHDLAIAIARVGLDKKALEVEIIHVRGKVDYADYIVILSGRSERQVAALAGHIEEQLLANHGARCLGIEGLPHGSWVLMDYGDVIVHVFHEDLRGYYDLESLWIDAARVSI